FESKQALDNYQAHPEHKAVMPFILEARTDRIVTDYEI
ncbi:MAG TPA: Dabb family protein, partial [Spirochaetota bacterium]|nr:Dabb family protein [Spirochaetota bacterium]